MAFSKGGVNPPPIPPEPPTSASHLLNSMIVYMWDKVNKGDTMKEWRGLMKVLEIKHLSKNGELLHIEKDVKNILHYAGEELILKILFAGLSVPEKYYIGLDSRTFLDPSVGIGSLFGFEPTDNAYERQQIQPDSFDVVTTNSGHRQANSPVILFKATGGAWGPVKNIFLTTNLGYGTNNVLISSAPLSRNITVSDGETITMKMGMALSNC